VSLSTGIKDDCCWRLIQLLALRSFYSFHRTLFHSPVVTGRSLLHRFYVLIQRPTNSPKSHPYTLMQKSAHAYAGDRGV